MSTQRLLLLGAASLLGPAWIAMAVTRSDSSRPLNPRESHIAISVDPNSMLGAADEDDDELGCPMEDGDGDDETDPAPGYSRV
jgi:hypothetical protein